MKKQVKIVTTLFMTIMIIVMLSNFVFGTSIITDIMSNTSATDTTGITKIGGKLVGIIQVLGIVVAIVVLLILGIKYMVGSAEEKAEYKKTMIPYVVGAILIFAASTIVNILFNVINSSTSGVVS